MINLLNTGNEPFNIKKHKTKICQLVLAPVFHALEVEFTEENFEDTDRGSNGHGSTGVIEVNKFSTRQIFSIFGSRGVCLDKTRIKEILNKYKEYFTNIDNIKLKEKYKKKDNYDYF